MLSAPPPDELEDEKSPQSQEEHPGYWRAQHRPGKLVGGGLWGRDKRRPFQVRLGTTARPVGLSLLIRKMGMTRAPASVGLLGG